ncbi:MAG TPA: riboflavin synthase [bacterium]|nr:riboflavin synthase [bacterium]
MFSGIVYCKGRVRSAVPRRDSVSLEIETLKDIISPSKGMSIAVNGMCLTAVSFRGKRFFKADVSGETMKKTTVKGLRPGAEVNIEFPLTAGGFISGHIVQGHIDTTGEVTAVTKNGANTIVSAGYGPGFDVYVVEKGSVAVDGTSLTVFDVKKGGFSAALIPATLKETIAEKYKKGDKVNLEFDIMAKYIEKQIKHLSGGKR